MSPHVALDADVLAGFRRGDDRAVRAVYQQFSGLVMSIAASVCHERGLAEEVTQQTFLQAWRHADSFDGDRPFAPWIATIARRAALDVVRREQRRATTPIDTADPGDASLVTLPVSETRAWEVGQVRMAVDALPPDERDIVRLQHLDGCTHAEIAEQLGLPLGTVKSRSFRAHRALAARLAHLREEST